MGTELRTSARATRAPHYQGISPAQGERLYDKVVNSCREGGEHGGEEDQELGRREWRIRGRREHGERRNKEWDEQEKRRQRNRGGGGQVIRGKSQMKWEWGDKRNGLGGSHGMRNGRNRKTGTEIGGFLSFIPIAVVNILIKAIREKRVIWLTTLGCPVVQGVKVEGT